MVLGVFKTIPRSHKSLFSCALRLRLLPCFLLLAVLEMMCFRLCFVLLSMLSMPLHGWQSVSEVIFVFGYLPHSWAYYDDFTRAGIYNQAREAPLLIKACRDGNIQQLTYYIKGYPLECWEDNRTRIESALNVTILSITQGSNNQLFELRVVAGCNLMGAVNPVGRYIYGR